MPANENDLALVLRHLRKIEELLDFPDVPGYVERAKKIALGLARRAPDGNVAELALRLVSDIDAHRQGRLDGAASGAFRLLLSTLRTALLESLARNNMH